LSVGLSGTDINGFIGTGSFVMDILTLPIFAGSIYSRVTYTYEATDPTTVVPEPASLALVGLGLVVAVATRRRRPGCAVAGSSPTRAHDLAVAG
jgi:hypothetical protein